MKLKHPPIPLLLAVAAGLLLLGDASCTHVQAPPHVTQAADVPAPDAPRDLKVRISGTDPEPGALYACGVTKDGGMWCIDLDVFLKHLSEEAEADPQGSSGDGVLDHSKDPVDDL